MESNELLQAISDIMDKKLEPIKSDLHSLKEEQSLMKSDLQKQIKRTERNLKAEIVESENLILQEVDDVHKLIIKHESDNTKHIA